jgi:Sigma-70, region 4
MLVTIILDAERLMLGCESASAFRRTVSRQCQLCSCDDTRKEHSLLQSNCKVTSCGNRLQVTRERIRQIESKALRKMRQPSRQGVLVDYHDVGLDSTPAPDRKGMNRGS